MNTWLSFITGGMAILITCTTLYVSHRRKRKALTARQETEAYKELSMKLEANYRHALTGTDKLAASIAGRAYYMFIRNGKLTMYDEQTLVNELSTMK